MGMRMGLTLSPRLQHRMKLLIEMPHIQWSLLRAYKKGYIAPPPFVPPIFEERVFTPRIKLEKSMIPNFENLDHVTRMRLVDKANEMFRFAYTRGVDEETGDWKSYFKIPLLRNRHIVGDPVEMDKIKVRIPKAEYDRATAMLEAVGEMERIVRAVPYYGLYKSVTTHLKKDHSIDLDQVVLVSVDRGGRIPCTILKTALGFSSMESLKVDQGGRGVDEDKLKEFADKGTLRGKHVLFVDSTVDSGRQINAIQEYFAGRTDLGFRSWSIVGSNENGYNLNQHYNVNWGVDPDTTFEDNPELTGIDYAPGTYTKVIEKPTEASYTIMRSIMSVPEGWIYSALDIDKQVAEQYKSWCVKQKERKLEFRKKVVVARTSHKEVVANWRVDRDKVRTVDKIERMVARATASKVWQGLQSKHTSLPMEAGTDVSALPVSIAFHNVLVVGSGKQDLPESSAQFVAEALGPHCSLFAGTSDGNPGAILKIVSQSQKVSRPEIRLYQPEHVKHSSNDTFAGTPVVFVGPEKDDMRRKMVSDSHVVLTLGGAEGTLREVLIAIEMGKPTVLIRGYGPVVEYISRSKRLTKKPHLKLCANLQEAVRTILTLS